MTRLVALLCLLPFAAPAQAPDDAAIRSILVERIDQAKKSVGMVVGIVDAKGTRIVSYGKFSGDNPKPVDGDTVFEIGSVSKTFTATLLADMVKRGEVSLSDPASKYLPGSVKMPSRDGKQITLLDLATQSSALARMPTNFHPKDPMNPYADYTVEQMYEFLSGYTLPRGIGEKYEYSNLGMGLLGHILTLKAGTSYEELMVKRICDPLKMPNTRIQFTPSMKAHLATGHNGQLFPVSNWDIPTLAGAGAIRSTVKDMLRYVAANAGLIDSPLLPAMRMAHASERQTGIPDMEIGLAWHILKKFDTELVWHNGGTGGYHSFIGFVPQRQVGIVVLSNSSNDIDDIGRHLLVPQYELAKPKPPVVHTEVQVEPKILEAYVGEYELAPNFILTMTMENGHLFTQATGQPKLHLFAESETKFFMKVVEAEVTFVRNDAGEATSVILHQNGRDMPAKKKR